MGARREGTDYVQNTGVNRHAYVYDKAKRHAGHAKPSRGVGAERFGAGRVPGAREAPTRLVLSPPSTPAIYLGYYAAEHENLETQHRTVSTASPRTRAGPDPHCDRTTPGASRERGTPRA